MFWKFNRFYISKTLYCLQLFVFHCLSRKHRGLPCVTGCYGFGSITCADKILGTPTRPGGPLYIPLYLDLDSEYTSQQLPEVFGFFDTFLYVEQCFIPQKLIQIGQILVVGSYPVGPAFKRTRQDQLFGYKTLFYI